ncbi:NAD(P)/FAD-dependent oxidoreductase [Rhodococcus wratislaviensis]|uniref:Putative ferredoxin reductase n=1 Tax=Rhodococcus wratislaviensis NBRC 100605 TaxID=1219028 RepID=X0Q830_RHOWR|nr:FAD-dependent oxidoreductase [Rhodococcus wratislaviensis]GAF47627.1 putative ferredoxin reductase [Rhodococcus wratislaviensis NBRC 100605]
MTGLSERTVVVVGASVAGVRTVNTLRTEGFDGRVVLIGAETHLPYDKPPLSKSALVGDVDICVSALASEDDLDRLQIECMLGDSAMSLYPGERRVRLASGKSLSYDELVIATGASARPSPWRADSGVHVLRTLDDAVALRACLVAGGPLVVIGGGLIGTEVAAAARTLGCQVTIVDPAPLPMARLAGEAVAARLDRLHRDRGVIPRYGVGVRSVTGVAGDLRLELEDDHRLEAATVLVGIGSVPNVEWLEGSGVPVDGGVVCDERLRVVGVPHLHAVGDVARWPHPALPGRVRAEHWTNAVDQARYVARALTDGADVGRYEPSDYVWTDQFDWKLQSIGHRVSGGISHVIGDLDVERPAVAVVHEGPDGTATGGGSVNWPRGMMAVRKSVDGRRAASEVVDLIQAVLP